MIESQVNWMHSAIVILFQSIVLIILVKKKTKNLASDCAIRLCQLLLFNSVGWLLRNYIVTKWCHGPKLTIIDQCLQCIKIWLICIQYQYHESSLTNLHCFSRSILLRPAAAVINMCLALLTCVWPCLSNPRLTPGLYFVLTPNMNFAMTFNLRGPHLFIGLQDYKAWQFRRLLGDWKLIVPSFYWKIDYAKLLSGSSSAS